MPNTLPTSVRASAIHYVAWTAGDYLAAVALYRRYQGTPAGPLAWGMVETAWGNVLDALRALRALGEGRLARAAVDVVRHDLDAAWPGRRVVLPSDADGAGRGTC